MHFIVLKENLNQVLSIVARNIPVRAQLPILSNILLKTEENQLKVAVTNLELGIVFTVGAKIEKEGEVTVPGKLLSEFTSFLSADKIEFILEGTNLVVKTPKTKASFTTIPSTDFPPFPTLPKFENNFSYKKIKDAISRTVFAASIDESRAVLTGVRTNIANNLATFAATDGYRLSIEKVELTDKKKDLSVILPAKSLAEVVRIAAELKAEEIGFATIENKNQMVFSLPKVAIFSRLLEGEFPNVEKIIPVGFKTKITVDREQFAHSVKTAALFARGAANIIKIKIEKDGLRIKAVAPQIGEDEDFVEAKVEGEEGEIAFNYRFLLDFFANFPEETLIFETSGPLSPGVFKSAANSSFLHIIMPVRVQE